MSIAETIKNVSVMIETGSSEKEVLNYVENLYDKNIIGDRLYYVCISMIAEYYHFGLFE